MDPKTKKTPAPAHTRSAASAAGAPAKALEVRCPSCGEKHIYSTDNPYRPFCSKGCKAIDLGAWASEQYRMESKPTTEDLPEDPGE